MRNILKLKGAGLAKAAVAAFAVTVAIWWAAIRGQGLAAAGWEALAASPMTSPPPCPPPVVAAVEPDRGSEAVAVQIAISGDYFQPAPVVKIGAARAYQTAYVSPTLVTAWVPPGLPIGTHDVRVCNPDGRCADLPDGYAVLPEGPELSGVLPRQGLNDAPNELVILGRNLRPGLAITLGGTALPEVAWVSPWAVLAVVPAGWPAGSYDLRAANPGAPAVAVLADAYAVLDPAQDDFFVDSLEIWTAPLTIRSGQPAYLGANVRRRGGTAAARADVAFYLGDPSAGQLLGGVTTAPIPPGDGGVEPVMIAWDTTGLAGAYEVTVVADPSSALPETTKTNNTARRVVQILPAGADIQPPRLMTLTVNGGAVETAYAAVTVSLEASDTGGAGLRSMALVEHAFNSAARAWVPVQTTGWVPYQPVSPLILTSHGGARVIQGWVADAAGNISQDRRLARIDYMPDVSRVRQGQVRIYQRRWSPGQRVLVRLETLSGDADLYVWAPGGQHMWHRVADGLAVDQVSIDAPVDGMYLIEVYGYLDSTYRLAIAPTAGVLGSDHAPAATAAKPIRSQPVVAPDSEPGDYGAIPAAPQPRAYLPLFVYIPPPETNFQHLPLVGRW
jgi:hypothetical protein